MRRSRSATRRGGVVLLAIVLLPVVLLTAGLAIDGALFYATRAQLGVAVRGAARSATRVSDAAVAQEAAEAVFQANFPDGLLMARHREIETFESDSEQIRVVGLAEAPTMFLRLLGPEKVTIRQSVSEPRLGQGLPVRLLADSGAFGAEVQDVVDFSATYPGCGGGDPAVCVNADLASEGLETPLFSRGRDVTPYENVPVHLGSADDPAWFRPTPDGPVALTWEELEGLVGKAVCVEVSADEIVFGVAGSVRRSQGRTAFTVTGLTPAPERTAAHPHWLVRLLPAEDVAGYCR